MKLLMLCALLCAVALTRADEKEVEQQMRQIDEDVFQREKKFLWWCPNGWTRFSGRCFQFIPRVLTWSQAEKNCQSMGGHLASLRNKGEDFWLRRMITSQGHGSQEVWIGGSTRETDQNWFWSDGTSFTFTFWCKGEPNNANKQFCLRMNHSSNKCWDDFQCNHHFPSVCAYEPSFLG